MTDWIDFAIYAAFLVTLYFVYPGAQQRLAIPVLSDRNADWVAAHPDIVHRMTASRWRLWLHYALGTISLAVLTSFQLGLWSPPPMPDGTMLPGWALLWNLTMASMVVAIILAGALGFYRHYSIRKHIPIAQRRQARLERRSLHDFVPRGVQLATYALVFINIAAWLIAAALGAHSSPVFWLRLASMVFLSAVFFLATRAMIARRANVMDRLFGPSYRRWEARYVFSMQLTTPMVGGLRLYEEVTGTMLFDMSRAMQLLLSLFIIYGFLRMARLPIDHDGGAPHRDAPASAPYPA